MYSLFERLSCWISIIDYFQLQMQACIISLTVIVKMDFISCCFICLETVSSFAGDFGQVIYEAVL